MLRVRARATREKLLPLNFFLSSSKTFVARFAPFRGAIYNTRKKKRKKTEYPPRTPSQNSLLFRILSCTKNVVCSKCSISKSQRARK